MGKQKAKLGRPEIEDPRKHKHTFRVNDAEQKIFKKGFKASRAKEKSDFIREKVLE